MLPSERNVFWLWSKQSEVPDGSSFRADCECDPRNVMSREVCKNVENEASGKFRWFMRCLTIVFSADGIE